MGTGSRDEMSAKRSQLKTKAQPSASEMTNCVTIDRRRTCQLSFWGADLGPQHAGVCCQEPISAVSTNDIRIVAKHRMFGWLHYSYLRRVLVRFR